jgi:hypothetical protein
MRSANSEEQTGPPVQRSFNRLYLVKCYRHHKFLFFLSIFFIGAVFYGHKTSCEITPALVLGMYTGSRQAEKDSLLLVTVNDQTPVHLYHTIDEPRRMMIFSTLAAYHQGVLAGFEDPQEKMIGLTVNKHPFLRPFSKNSYNTRDDYALYPAWLLKYMQGALGEGIKKITISQQYIHYDDRNLPVADSTHSLYEFEFEQANTR